jgi:hypothetical protein
MGEHLTQTIVMGVMVIPSNSNNRAAIRATWLSEASASMLVRFVAGDVACARKHMQREADEFGDVAFVASRDCTKHVSPEKVHAWFTYAVHRWRTPWIGKMEDDGVLWPSALMTDLNSLPQAPHQRTYVGIMQWQGSCKLNEVTSADGNYQRCAACWGGWFEGGRGPSSSNCPPMVRRGVLSFPGAEGSFDCPSLHFNPFACGPLEVRSRALALDVASCAYADRYFSAMSVRKGANNLMCVSADGGQGHAIGHCIPSLEVADLGSARQRFGTIRQLNGSNAVMIVHPIKKGILEEWERSWHFMRRAPYRPAPIGSVHLAVTNSSSRPTLARYRLPASEHRSSRRGRPKSGYAFTPRYSSTVPAA